MQTVIVSVVLLLVVGGAVRYIYKSKKQGVKCIGCPHGGKCSGNCAACNAVQE
ncbi:MAG: FeoB-associated Cys-rich membrane protein [Clostridia bacterium]|nr:FeoB-associated Cys-rich membrane protein [Clostridia bacterium]